MKIQNMSMPNKEYTVICDAPKEISWEQYCRESIKEYNELLSTSGDDENMFQNFFERNPAFVPGALELIGRSGHYPYMNALISQPKIGTLFNRIPDFVWLAQDSLHFCPVFIEIEKPNKKMFTQNRGVTADFSQAMGQIRQWKAILNKPMNVLQFYDTFAIPDKLRSKQFAPQYLLIYGRRSEYENNDYLTALRYQNQEEDTCIISYDRLSPVYEYKDFVTCKVKMQNYVVQHIPPTYRYRADSVEELYNYSGFYEKIDQMEKTTIERKDFLKDRFCYWHNFKGIIRGLIVSQEGE